MRAPVPFRFLVEDYQDAPAWLGRIFTPINRFIEQTLAVLDQGVSLGENIQARKYSTNLATSSSYSSGAFDSIQFSWTYGDLPSALLITRVVHQDGTLFLGTVGTPQWVYNSGNIVVSYVPGLANSKNYTINFLAI